ncbi:hypothetical protein [uncultured Neglectibacter sp.]|uniref:hypothetical protein n=1 Tax=uncultured Neglectibacter sp. TaxID=1924108 RepID=UPI0034DE2B88
MKKNRIFHIFLALVLAAVLAAGGFSLDILINGKRLPLSRESVRSIEVYRFPPPTHKKFRWELAEDKNKIEETLSFLNSFRYGILEEEMNRAYGDTLFDITVTYQHHQEIFYFYPDAILIRPTAEAIITYHAYVAQDTEKYLEAAARLEEALFGS